MTPAVPAVPATESRTGWRRLPVVGGWRSDVVLPLVPVVAVIGIQLTLLIGGPWFDHLLHVPGAVTRANLRPLIEVLTVPSVIALVAGWMVVRRARLGRRLPALLVALMVVDLAVFNLGIQATPDIHAASSASAAPANRLATLLEAQGPGPAGGLHRIGMFDPDRFYPVDQNRIGQPDLTLLRSLDDVQGYGAVVDERYDAETGTHLQLNLTPAALSGPTFTQLDLGLLVTVPEYFIHLVGRPPGFTRSMANGAVPLPPVAPDASAPTDASVPGPTPVADYDDAAAPAPTSTLSSGVVRTQYFGTVLSVTAVTVPLPVGGSGALRVGLLSSNGRATRWLSAPRVVNGRSAVTVMSAGAPRPASAIVLLATGGPVTVGDALVRTAGQGSYRVDGSLRDIVTAPRWHFVGTDSVFSVFAQPGARGRAWVTGPPGASAQVVSDSPWGDETIRVDTPRPATLVRSVQFAAGWRATVTADTATGNGGGTARSVSVGRDGLMQSVPVPAGVHLVHFTYRPTRDIEALAASAVGVLVVVLLALGPSVVARRRRRRAP